MISVGIGSSVSSQDMASVVEIPQLDGPPDNDGHSDDDEDEDKSVKITK